MKLLIKGGTVVTAQTCQKRDVLIDEEQIIRIEENIVANNVEVMDATGKLLFPGFIDTHTHFDLEGACKTADDFYTGTKAAIIGGTTMVLDFATQDRGTSSIKTLEKWHNKADNNSSCDYGFHMSYTEWNELLLEELPKMVEEGITSFKLYMAYDNLLVSEEVIEDILIQVKKIHGIVGTHCEVGEMVNLGVLRELEQKHYAPYYHPISRPPIVEAKAINKFLAIAKKVDVPVNIVHLSTALGFLEVQKARESGQKVYIETCPQYLLLEDSCYETDIPFEGAKYVLSPPLRKKEDCEALWQAMQEDSIDFIGTDHCSFNYKKDKELGIDNFSKIPNGIPGVEHRPVLLYSLGVEQGRITINQMVDLLATKPAKIFGLYPRKGEIAVGADADIVIWDPDMTWCISSGNQVQNVDYTPYEGMQVKGKAQTVFLRGKKIVEDGKLICERQGRYIKRGKSIYV